ncbi:MAG: hypothetical protein AB8I08_08220 [Sandaracinaceae bacterium]
MNRHPVVLAFLAACLGGSLTACASADDSPLEQVIVEHGGGLISVPGPELSAGLLDRIVALEGAHPVWQDALPPACRKDAEPVLVRTPSSSGELIVVERAIECDAPMPELTVVSVYEMPEEASEDLRWRADYVFETDPTTGAGRRIDEVIQNAEIASAPDAPVPSFDPRGLR